MPTDISVISANLPHPIQFNLFDNVRVSLKLRKSHAHRHMVYMTLVDLEHVEVVGKKSANPVRMTNKDMIHAIEEEEAVKSETNKKPSSRKKKKQTSMSEILEKFSRMSVIETRSTVDKSLQKQ